MSSMTLSTFALYGTIASFGTIFIGFVWLFATGRMERVDVSEDEAAQRTQRALMDVRNPEKRVWFKGKAWGASWATSIATYDIILLMKRGDYAAALPYAVTAIGALGAFLFMPMWVMALGDAPIILNILFTGLFVVTAVRAAWPRASSSELLKDPTKKF